MAPAALFGVPGLALRKGVIFGVYVYTLLCCVLSTHHVVWGRANPEEGLTDRLVVWKGSRGLGGGDDFGGRSQHGSRAARQVPDHSTQTPDNTTVQSPDIPVTDGVTDVVTEAVTDAINTTTQVTNSSVLTSEAPPSDGVGQGAGVIVGAIFGVLLGGAILGGALYLLIRYKRAQAAEYNRSVQLHMSSTRNAGVYVDLAEPSDLPRDYTAMKHQNNSKGGKKDQLMHPDLYEYDSDDEVCVYN